MLICLDKSVGSIVASDEYLDDAKYVKCDGRMVYRRDYPKLFTKYEWQGNTLRAPDLHRLSEEVFGEISYYLIAD